MDCECRVVGMYRYGKLGDCLFLADYCACSCGDHPMPLRDLPWREPHLRAAMIRQGLRVPVVTQGRRST